MWREHTPWRTTHLLEALPQIQTELKSESADLTVLQCKIQPDPSPYPPLLVKQQHPDARINVATNNCNVSDCERCHALPVALSRQEWDANVVKSEHSLLQRGLTSLTAPPRQCATLLFVLLCLFACVSRHCDTQRERGRDRTMICAGRNGVWLCRTATQMKGWRKKEGPLLFFRWGWDQFWLNEANIKTLWNRSLRVRTAVAHRISAEAHTRIPLTLLRCLNYNKNEERSTCFACWDIGFALCLIAIRYLFKAALHKSLH